MKTLYMVRHAKSSWDYPHLSDFDRPLNGRGERDAPMMGDRLKRKNILPDCILSSPANRALTTASIIASCIDFPLDEIDEKEEIYHASEFELLKTLKLTSNHCHKLMVFGHNPGFTYFINSLANAAIENVPTCGIAGISLEVDHWANLSFGEGRLLFFDYPKNRRSQQL